MEDTLLTIKEAAQVLRIQVSTLRRWQHEQRAPKGIKVGRQWLFPRHKLDEFLDELQSKEVEVV